MSNGFHSLEEEVLYLRGLRTGDGNSNSSKHSDSMSDSGNNNNGNSGGNIKDGGGGGGGSNIPEVLIKDLTQTKRQLLQLHNLVSRTFLSLFLFF